MKKTFAILFVSVLLLTQTSQAQFWKATGALEKTGATFLDAAAHVGNSVYALGNNNSFVYSTDKGLNWTTQTAPLPNGTVLKLMSTPDRLYAQVKINGNDYELHYTTDHGATWVMDTVGLHQNLQNTGKPIMFVEYMDNNYVLAYNINYAFYKQLGDSTWTRTGHIGSTINDVATLGNKWYIMGSKIYESNDFGVNWNEVNTTGLPSGFLAKVMASNSVDRLYVSNAIQDGGEDIYMSTDGGSNWILTNSAGHYDYNNPWILQMYAVNDYVFASIYPEAGNYEDPPNFLISRTAEPFFEVGDTSGLRTGGTTTHLPFYFHIDDELFTMFWDVYKSEPGFTGVNTTSLVKTDYTNSGIYPNPTNESFRIKINKPTKWTLRNMEGKILKSGTAYNDEWVSVAEFANGIYIVLLENELETKAMKLVKQ